MQTIDIFLARVLVNQGAFPATQLHRMRCRDSHKFLKGLKDMKTLRRSIGPRRFHHLRRRTLDAGRGEGDKPPVPNKTKTAPVTEGAAEELVKRLPMAA